jgi:hypothetical protein
MAGLEPATQGQQTPWGDPHREHGVADLHIVMPVLRSAAHAQPKDKLQRAHNFGFKALGSASIPCSCRITYTVVT